MLTAALRLVGAALRDHDRNRHEMQRSDGLLIMGHLLRCAHASHFTPSAVDALVEISEACRDAPALHQPLLESVLLRFEIWKRLSADVRSAHLALLQGLAAQDERAAVAAGLTQKVLDAARPDVTAAGFGTMEGGGGVAGGSGRASGGGAAGGVSPSRPDPDDSHPSGIPSSSLHEQHLHTASLAASPLLAQHGAWPLLAHALTCGEAQAQADALRMLVSLALVHGEGFVAAMQYRGGLLAVTHLLLSPPRCVREIHIEMTKMQTPPPRPVAWVEGLWRG
jgi:hypothetical protein